MEALIWIIFIGAIVVGIAVGIAQAKEMIAGQVHIICPHCNVKGQVTVRPVRRKKGISGGKATGALLTGGVSILATGLSRKEPTTACRCGNCGTRWDI